ncbi:MAG: ATP-binding cassette domain-containing protein [Bacilli bacterium]|nr:ATP-binding cassette domain-containing protein [Bacilli bacterium]
MFILRNLIKEYPGGRGNRPIVALNIGYLSLPESGMVFVVGKSGSGKSTLLHLLGGLDKPTSGDLLIHGKNASSFSERDLDSYRNSCVGFVFQDFGLIDEFTVRQNIGFALELQSEKSDEEKIASVLNSLEMPGFDDRRIDTLSGGQKQRVAIARALVKNPSVILADEPTGALDEESGNGVLSILRKLSKEKLVVIVSHDTEAARKYADRIIELKDGRIVKDTVDSEEKEADEERANLTLRKSRIPFLKGLKIGLSAAIHKPLKLVTCSMLVAFALSFFGLVTTLTFFDDARARTGVATTMHCESDLFQKNAIFEVTNSEYDYRSGQTVKSEKTTETAGVMSSDQDVAKLNASSKTGLDFAGVFGKDLYSFQYKNGSDLEDPLVFDQLHSFLSFSGFIDCGETYLARNGMSMLFGTYPTASNEIAISKYHSEILAKSNPELFDGEIKNVIGTELSIDFKNYTLNSDKSLFTITGIVDTGEVNNYYLERYEKGNHTLDSKDIEMLTEYLRGSFHCLGYVSSVFAETFHDVFAEGLSSLYSHKGVYFAGIELEENESSIRPSADSSLGFVLPKYTDMEQYSFYAPDGESLTFEEPASNEIYVDGSYYEEKTYRKLKDFLLSVFVCVHDAFFEYKMLPEADSYFASTENLAFFNHALSLFESFDLDSFELAIKSDRFENNVKLVINSFAKLSFERMYIKYVLASMNSLNASGHFGIEDLSLDSEFMSQYGLKVDNCGLSEEFDSEVFDGCYEYIKSHPSLRLFARKALCYELFLSLDKSNTYKDIYEKVSLMVLNGNGDAVSQSDWDDLLSAFDSLCSDEENLEFIEMPFAKNNLVDYERAYSDRPFEYSIECPHDLFYVNHLGVKGKLTVKGYYLTSGRKDGGAQLYFANEDFLRSLTIAPSYVNTKTYSTDYKDVDGGKYNYVITKTDFSFRQVKEICMKGEGFEYRFTNALMYRVDYFITVMWTMCMVFAILAGVLGFFAVLLLATFIASSVDYKKKEVGIIRCLGGREKDVFLIFASEGMVITMASVILSVVLSLIECFFINRFAFGETFGANLLYYGPLNVLTVLICSIVIASLATFLPIHKRTKMAPSVALRKE